MELISSLFSTVPYYSYVEGFISALKTYLKKYGDDGKTHFNEAVTQSELAVVVNELGDKVLCSYIA